jgi:DNA uptake protein ComE-like DNA-binding protein
VATSAPRPSAGSCSEPAPVPAGGTTSSTLAPKPQPGPQTQPLVNLNTATYAQIMALPHIDKVLTDRIVAQRAVQPFASLDDMRHRVSRFPSAVTALVTV